MNIEGNLNMSQENDQGSDHTERHDSLQEEIDAAEFGVDMFAFRLMQDDKNLTLEEAQKQAAATLRRYREEDKEEGL